MTGPEHYQKAQELLAAADIAIGQYEENGWAGKREIADSLTAQAQVHATLALAAATAMNDSDGGMGASDWNAWREVVSVNPHTPAGGES